VSGGTRQEARAAQVVTDLVAIAQTPAPTFAETPRLEWLERRLADAPGTRSRDEAGNLVWRWGEGGPRVLVAAHVDNVFDADTDLTVRRAGRTLIGPGVGDNAAAIAVTLNAVESLLAGPPLAPGAVAFTVGEEGLGNLKGARAVTAALAPLLFIAVEGHLLDRLLVDAVGSIRARVSVHGPGGHPWVDRGRQSALHALLAVGQALIDAPDGDSCINIGLASGGRSVNSIADQAELVVECRSLEPSTLERFEAQLAALEVPAPLTLQADVLGNRPAGRLDRNHELLRTVVAVREELGLETLLDAGSTDANAALGNGIPALALGVAHGGEMHTPSEWIDETSLDLGYRQLHTVLERLLA
jgi:acetylornithine deacetylase/succinyl-diaminopimelate desuccinylase-like protein